MQLRQADGRGRERAEKIDTVMKENTRLNAVVMSKVDEIKKLQLQINKMDSKLEQQSSELNKLKTESDTLKQIIREQDLEVDSLRHRYEAEAATRREVQENLLRHQQDNSALKFSLEKAVEEQNTMAEQHRKIQEIHQR